MLSQDAILSSLNRRYATKIFDTQRKVSPDVLETIKESLRLTPSSFGLQPRKFVIIDDDKTKSVLKKHAFDQSQIDSCSHLIVLCGYNNISDNDIDVFVQRSIAHGGDPVRLANYQTMLKRNILQKRQAGTLISYIDNQVYIALGNVLQTCAHLRIDACPMGGFDAVAFDEVLGMQHGGVHSVVLCAIGYRADEDSYAQRQKFRYSDTDIFLNYQKSK